MAEFASGRIPVFYSTTQQDHSCIAEYVNYLEEILIFQAMSGIVRVGIRTIRCNFGYGGVHRGPSEKKQF